MTTTINATNAPQIDSAFRAMSPEWFTVRLELLNGRYCLRVHSELCSPGLGTVTSLEEARGAYRALRRWLKGDQQRPYLLPNALAYGIEGVRHRAP